LLPPESWRGNILNVIRKNDTTVVETWREIQSYNIEFTMKRLREPTSR